jgi:hypothetical protein
VIAKKKPKKPKKPKVCPLSSYGIVEEEDAEIYSANTLVAVVCFFTDFINIRAYCHNIWSKTQPAGPISRSTATMISNQAVELVKVLEYELKTEFPRLAKTQNIYDLVMEKAEDAEPEAKIKIEETFMLPIFFYLDGFSEVIQDGGIPVPEVPCLPPMY